MKRGGECGGSRRYGIKKWHSKRNIKSSTPSHGQEMLITVYPNRALEFLGGGDLRKLSSVVVLVVVTLRCREEEESDLGAYLEEERNLSPHTETEKRLVLKTGTNQMTEQGECT